MTNINYLDAAVVIILVICVLSSKSKGISYFAVSVAGKIISLALSLTLYGTVSRILRGTYVFAFIKERVGNIIDAEALPYVAGFSDHMMANDNNEIYKLFNVQTFSDYASSYIANIAVNIISVLIVYICVSAVIGLIFRVNSVFSGLPIIKQLNWVTGSIAGIIEGTVLIWIAVVALTFFALQGRFTDIYETLLSSRIAIYFLKYNIFAAVIFKVVP